MSFSGTDYVRSGSSPSPVFRCSKTKESDVRKIWEIVTWERKLRFALSLCKESVKYNVKCLHYDEACHYSGQYWNDHWNSSSLETQLSSINLFKTGDEPTRKQRILVINQRAQRKGFVILFCWGSKGI